MRRDLWLKALRLCVQDALAVTAESTDPDAEVCRASDGAFRIVKHLRMATLAHARSLVRLWKSMGQ